MWDENINLKKYIVPDLVHLIKYLPEWKDGLRMVL